jgi:Flp pilus assembly protein TadG
MATSRAQEPGSMHIRTTLQKRRTRGDGGAALVEAAIGSGLFLTLILGVFEFGALFRNYITVADITRSGARAESAYADDRLADYDTLQAIRRSVGALATSDVEYIVVFKAPAYNSSIASVSATCAAGTAVAGVCNVFHRSDLTAAVSAFGCDAGEVDASWCPTSRQAAVTGPPDYVGVYLKVTHRYMTRILGNTKTLADQTIIRIEPQRQ